MAMDSATFERLLKEPAPDAWRRVIEQTIAIASLPLTAASAPGDVTKRDREIGTLDLFLSACGWDLWQDFGSAVERTSERLVRWWAEPYSAKAILILDGLSLRELPWMIEGAKKRGFTLHAVTAHASELPSETNAFARALGFGSRSQLQNNGGAATHKLTPARTECVDLPWKDCADLIDSTPNWIFWHPWPDSMVHDGAGAGQGLDTLTRDAAERLLDDAFWAFVERLAVGRRVVITSDHGYAATGLFFDAGEAEAAFLKATFKSGRFASGAHDPGPFIPPVALSVNNAHGENLLAVGRWKWRSQGGYPTLAHGGASLLEVLTPFVELTK
nr:hypothetical protein [uncultured Rhodopila sp.]